MCRPPVSKRRQTIKLFFRKCETVREAVAGFADFLEKNPDVRAAVEVDVGESECEGFRCSAEAEGYGVCREASFLDCTLTDNGSGDAIRRDIALALLRERNGGMGGSSWEQPDEEFNQFLMEHGSDVDEAVRHLVWHDTAFLLLSVD